MDEKIARTTGRAGWFASQIGLAFAPKIFFRPSSTHPDFLRVYPRSFRIKISLPQSSYDLALIRDARRPNTEEAKVGRNDRVSVYSAEKSVFGSPIMYAVLFSVSFVFRISAGHLS